MSLTMAARGVHVAHGSFAANSMKRRAQSSGDMIADRRYAYALAREGVLPSVLARTHPRFKSPHVASTVQALLAALIVGLFAYFTGTDDPKVQAYLGVYTLLAVLGTLLLLILQATRVISTFTIVSHP